MNPGTLLLAVAFLGGFVATVALFADYVRRTNEYAAHAERGLAALSLGLVLALAYLTYQFVVTDYSNAYVWENTADYLPLLYRVTGVYAANEGSILLWATIASAVALGAAVSRGLAARSTKLVQGLVVGFVTYLAGMLLLQSPFESVWSAVDRVPAGVVPQAGRGLNPLLVDPFMAIHPPVMFTSYALLTMPFAIGVAHFVSMVRGEGGLYDEWVGSLTRWLRVSWLFLTTAVALGAFWSYTVLGWGGLWAWDPVETAILVPWLFLTATMHATVNYRPEGRYTVLAPAMTATSLALAVYTTSVVRSGVFRSVHSFASGGIGASLLVLMALTLALGVGLPFLTWLRLEDESDDSAGGDGSAGSAGGDGSDESAGSAGGDGSAGSAGGDGGDDSGTRFLTRATLVHGAVLLLGLLTFISLWGLTFPVLRDATTGIQVSVESRYYNLWSFPIVLATLLLLGFYMDFDVEGKRRSLVALGVITVATLVAAAVAPSEAWYLGTVRSGDALVYRVVAQTSALAVFPPVAYVGLAVGKRGYARITAAAGNDARRKEVGITLIHVSVALLVFSLPFTYMFASEASVIAGTTGQSAGDVVEVPDSDYAIRVLDQHQRTIPQDPAPSTYALSSEAVLNRGEAINGTTTTVYGEVTNVRTGERATVIQLDGSGLWVGVTGSGFESVTPSTGQTIVAHGVVMRGFVPTTEAVVLAQPKNVGTPENPPADANPTRVRVTSADLAIYRGGELVTTGTAGQRTYVARSGMQLRDVVVDRGLVADTYVIASVSDGQVSLTVKRIPFMTPVRLSVLGLLAGMTLVLLYDPRHGLRTTARAAERESTTDPTASD